MGYERDADRATRGPGAIAALDRSGNRRDARRIASARATIRRDRAMAAVTHGALGRIDQSPVRTPLAFNMRRPMRAPITVTQGRPISARFDGAPVTPKPPMIETPPIVAVPPTPVPAPVAVVSPPRATGGGGGGGGGGGTVATTGGAKPGLQIAPIAALPPMPAPVEAAAATDNTTRNLAIAGGAAVALFLLLRRKGK